MFVYVCALSLFLYALYVYFCVILSVCMLTIPECYYVIFSLSLSHYTMKCLIRGRCGHIWDRLNISRSDFQNNMAVSMIFKMCTCVLRLVFVTTPPPPQPPRSMGLKPGSNKPSKPSLSVCLCLSLCLCISLSL